MKNYSWTSRAHNNKAAGQIRATRCLRIVIYDWMGGLVRWERWNVHRDEMIWNG